MEQSFVSCMQQIVGLLAEKYEFDYDDAMSFLDMDTLKPTIQMAKTKGVAGVVASKRTKPKYPLPFHGDVIDDCCRAIVYNGGLFTQCLKEPNPDTNSSLCKTCEKQAKEGTPLLGWISDRVERGEEWADPAGRRPVPYTKVMKLKQFTQEEVMAEVSLYNLTIDTKHFIEPDTEKRGRKKGAKKMEIKPVFQDEDEAAEDEEVGGQWFQDMMEIAKDSRSDTSEKSKATSNNSEKAEKKKQKEENDMMKQEDKAAKAIQKAEKDAKDAAEKAVKKAARAEKAEKAAQEAAEKAARKALKDAAKAAKLAADEVVTEADEKRRFVGLKEEKVAHAGVDEDAVDEAYVEADGKGPLQEEYDEDVGEEEEEEEEEVEVVFESVDEKTPLQEGSLSPPPISPHLHEEEEEEEVEEIVVKVVPKIKIIKGTVNGREQKYVVDMNDKKKYVYLFEDRATRVGVFVDGCLELYEDVQEEEEEEEEALSVMSDDA
jgi:hypothetical protein